LNKQAFAYYRLSFDFKTMKFKYKWRTVNKQLGVFEKFTFCEHYFNVPQTNKTSFSTNIKINHFVNIVCSDLKIKY